MPYPFIPAKYQWSRPKGTYPALLVLHSMEAPEKGDTAETCARYFQNPPRVASAHLCVDNNSVVQSVQFEREAAGAKGGPYRGSTINGYGIHIEHAGYARQTPDDWADPFSTQMLYLSSMAAADICIRYHIPPYRLSVPELASGKSGICTHFDVTKAFNVSGGHTDPGLGFPIVRYTSMINWWIYNTNPLPPPDTEDDMFTDADRERMQKLEDEIEYLRHVQDDILRPKLDAVYIDTHADDHNNTLAGRVKNTAVKLDVPVD